MTSLTRFSRDLFRQGQYVLFVTAADKVSFFITFLLIARLTNTASYGIITTVFAFCNMVQVLFESGMSVYFQRESADPQKNVAAELSSALSYRLWLFFPLLALSYFYFMPDASVRLSILFVGAASVFGLSVNVMLNAILYGKGMYRQSFVAILYSRGILLLAVPLLGLLEFPPAVLLSAIVASSAVHLVMLMKNLKGLLLGIRLSFEPASLRKTLRSSLPIGVGLVLVAIYDRVDILIIQKLLSYEAVALYAVAYSLYRLPQALYGMILVPSYTNFSKDFAVRGMLSSEHVVKTGALMLITSLAFVALFLAFGRMLVPLFYGNAYDASGSLLTTLSFALPGVFMNSFTGVVLNSIRKERLVTIATAVGAFVNVSANIILIRSFGVFGAALATIATEYTVLALECVILARYRSLIRYSPPS